MLLISKLLYSTSSPCAASRFSKALYLVTPLLLRIQDEASSLWYSEVYSYHKWAQVKVTTLGTSKVDEEARRGISTG